MRYCSPAGFATGEEFYAHLRDAFDVLYREGTEGSPKMLSIGLHCRIAGRPARTAALERFLDHVRCNEDVWITRRIDIAEHWRATHPPAP
jgi:peptidoglycan/xylan/chitin deacetylase (PgdA/CDA1 family)